MSIYAVLVTGNNLSEFVQQLTAQDEAIRTLERGTVEASVKPVGLLQNKSDYAWSAGAGDAIRYWNGSAWSLVMDPRAAQINAAGTVPMAADLPMGGNKISGLGAATASGHAVEYSQLGTLIAGAWTGNHDAGGQLLVGLGSPFGQSSDAVAARYDDTWQTTHGLMRYVDACSLDDGSGSGSPANLNSIDGGKRTDPSASTTFCPRHVHIVIAGTVTLVGGGALGGTLAETHFDAWRTDANSGAWVTVGTFTHAAISFAVDVWFKAGGPRGFYLRIRRVSNNALHTASVAHAWCFSGVGMA